VGISGVVGSLLGSTVGEFRVLRTRKKLSAVAAKQYAEGNLALVAGCVYGLHPLSPGTWVGGDLAVEPGRVIWYPGGLRKRDGQVIDAASFEAVKLRQITSRESWAVGPGCIALAGELGRVRVEIAVLEDDIVLVVDALQATRLLD
jgi:hypothetical protein